MCEHHVFQHDKERATSPQCQYMHVIEVSNEICALLGELVGAPTNSSSPCLSLLLFLDVVVVVVVGRKGAKRSSSFSSDMEESVDIN